MFYRLTTDGRRIPADLVDAWAGPTPTPCWLVGGGPSLAALPTDAISGSPAPRFAVNLAGHGLLRPTFWTSYDPTARFHRSIYLDPSITKFVHRCRAMDVIPQTTFKVCDAPATYCFDRDPQRGFTNLLGDRTAASAAGGDDRPAALPSTIVDWQDSLIQAIGIAYALGFRTLYLAGCEMCIRPEAAHLDLGAAVGVAYRDREPLRDFFDRCRRAGVAREDLVQVAPAGQYHFDESKSFAAAVQTDFHYFRVAQYLRLARRALALAGMELISVTPDSRLNDHFPYQSVEAALADIRRQVGDPAAETTRGRYSCTSTSNNGAAPMRDFPPHNWTRTPQNPPAVVSPPTRASDARRQRLRAALDDLPEIPVPRPN